MKIGIGTYAIGGVASYLGLGPSLREKFQMVKAMGYDSVELLPTDLMNDIGDIMKWRDEFGLTITSIHAEPTEDMVKVMAALGGKAVIWPGTPFCNKEEAIEVARQLDEMAEMAAPMVSRSPITTTTGNFIVPRGSPCWSTWQTTAASAIFSWTTAGRCTPGWSRPVLSASIRIGS